MIWLSGEDQSFKDLRAVTHNISTTHHRKTEFTVASFSMYSSGAPKEARPISCNYGKKIISMTAYFQPLFSDKDKGTWSQKVMVG